MATLEKPKKEKTKRTKIKTEILATQNENEETESLCTQKQKNDLSTSSTSALAATNISTGLERFEEIHIKSTNEIISHDCYISTEYKEPDPDDGMTLTSTSLHDELLDAAIMHISSEAEQKNSANDDQPLMLNCEEQPSAPPADLSTTAQAVLAPKSVVVQYPNLSPLQQVEQKSQIVYQVRKVKATGGLFSPSQLKPFTVNQLKEIYDCAELELVKQFELEFLMNSLLETYESDPLYAALNQYYNLQSKIKINLYDVQKYRKEALEAQEIIWVKVPITKTFLDRCGDGNEVKTSVSYDVIKVDSANLEAASAALPRLSDLVCYNYTTNAIAAKITKVKIDQMINEIISYPRIADIAELANITLHTKLDADTLQCVAQLRRAISILFSFARKLSPNTNFEVDLKLWLRKLISLHLLIATKEDHWFLLFNILRCPSGVGTWAAEFLQIPFSRVQPVQNVTTTPTGSRPSILPLQINSPEINHCIAVLQILLLPIKKRNDYLKEFTQEISDPVKEERWILVDSDGEDSHTSTGDCVGLKESDLIVLLNQIPFEKLFASALCIEKFLDDYIIEPDMISAPQMLKVVAFLSKLIEILGEGMLTYNIERYKQLAKRLGRLVRHSLQYVSDYHEMFISNKLAKDPNMCERINVELHALLIKACSYIYRTRNLATWQYFSSLPFYALDAETIWQIFYYLNVGFPNDFPTLQGDPIALFNSADFWSKFNVANVDLSAEDFYYLLQAFFEMANERDKVKDWDLIKEICLHIFNIGFINEMTRETCYKTSRDMLVNITLAYENLMSCLLLQLKIRFSEIDNAIYLFKSLPLENWKPDMDSFEILSNWLLHYDFKTQENMLARIVISHLNWGFDCDGRLFLPHNIHVRMACLIAEALIKHAPEVLGLSGISESVRQVSSLIDFTQSTKEQFTTWCWSMVSILRLHLMDQSVESIKRSIQNPTEPLLFIPELERIDMIYQGVTENRPLSIYVGILISLHGHSIPLICQKGFELMGKLLSDHRHAAVIRCIELIIPLFLEIPDTLANCERFHQILSALLTADKTYLKMAKDIVYPNAVGPVLELFDNMIHHQIICYTNYGLNSPLNLINVWLNCFTALPNWQTTNVLYLLDKILRVAYQFPDCRAQVIEYFHNYYKDCDDWKGVNKRSAIKKFFTQPHSRIPTLSHNNVWLAMVLLEIEFQTQDTQFWSEFLRQLTTNNLDNALKKTFNIVKLDPFPSQMLVIYKYANLIANMDINHPLFPILLQKFFELYLWRVPTLGDEHSFQSTFGVSNKFYEHNIPLMKKIKTNVKAAENLYTNEATKRANDEAYSYFYHNCAKMMKTYILWLEETNINKLSKDELNFPPQYNNEKLREILNGNNTHWTEFIYPSAIRREQRYQSEQWARKCFRMGTTTQLRNPLQPKPKNTPIHRIKSHLATYDKALNAPEYIKPSIEIYKEIKSTTLPELKNEMKTLNSTATKFHFKTCELNSLNRNYLDLVLELYQMVPYNDFQIKDCNSLIFNRKCTSPARITVTKEHIRKNDEVDRKIKSYNERHHKIIDEMLQFNVEDFAQSIEKLGAIIRLLLSKQQTNKNEMLTKTGASFFYNIIENMTDITMKFPPTHDFYSQILGELGIFIQENQEQEGSVVLALALKRPDLLKVLSGVFMPFRTRPVYFLEMYKFIIDSHLKRCDTKIIFVLLSKFDLVTWMETQQPKLSDISQLLHLVVQGLESWSQPDSILLQDQFRRHLVHIFDYDFPQRYGEVMQIVLDRVSDQKLMPVLLLDLLNSLLQRFQCDAVSLETNSDTVKELSMDFARRQNIFNLKAATETLYIFARHFQKERLHHGLHGLYPKHKDYCIPLSMWFSVFGHVVVSSAICTYQELLADQISDVVFGSIIEMYSPWLITYTEQTMQQQPTSNWIRQLTDNGKMLQPWSEQHAGSSKIIIETFVNTLLYILEYLPASNKILDHTFSWYQHHFAITNIEKHILAPIHEGIALLPWEQFKPQPQYIDMLYESLAKFIPESHAMLGHIFIRINWTSWFTEILPNLPANVQTHVISRLFVVFVKISFEPNIHVHINTSKILEDAINCPWHMVDYAELENLLKWFVLNVEPSLILKIPSESNYADRAVLDLLCYTCAMMPERLLENVVSNAQAKRMLYTRSMVRLLRACAAKNKKLLLTKEGERAFNAAFMELLRTMDKSIAAQAVNKTLEEQRREALNLMIEILAPMQTQSEETSNLHIGTLLEWQQQCAAANILMCSTLHAIGHMNTFIAGTYTLLENSIANYFRTSESTKDRHSPTWSSLMESLQMSLAKLELMPIMRGPYFFTLHIFVLFKLQEIENTGDKITFLQDLSQLVESLKTNQQTEPRLAIVWGVIISRGCMILSESVHAKKPLLMLARHLQIVSTESEGWSDGLLGAIGLKKDIITNRRKVLTRCLACVIFSLFPHNNVSISQPNEEFLSALRELSMLLANKKFNDVKHLVVRAVSILNEEKMPTLSNVPHLICRLIGLFFEEEYLTTIPEVWEFDYKLK